MKNKIVTLLLSTTLLLTACGNSSESQAALSTENTAAVTSNNQKSSFAAPKETDTVPESTIESTITEQEVVDTTLEPAIEPIKTIEITEGLPDSSAYEEFSVQLTMDNYTDYMSFALIDRYNSVGELMKYPIPIMISTIYDDGWVLTEFENFSIETKELRGYSHKNGIPYDEIWTLDEINTLSDFTVIDIKGELTFQRIEVIDTYDTSRGYRIVKSKNKEHTLQGGYYNEEYPY